MITGGARLSEIQAGFTFDSKAAALASKAFGPWFAKRQADAHAYATITAALAEIAADQIEANPSDPTMLEALISCGGKTNLENLGRILSKASRQLVKDARPDLITDDWAANFRDKSRTCSDPDVVELWAQLLASEANKPGSYSRKTVNILGDMSKADAELFANLCRFQLIMGISAERVPVITRKATEIYEKYGLTRHGLDILHELGLVGYSGDPLGGVSLGLVAQCGVLGHSEGILHFVRRDGTTAPSKVDIGSVTFTRTGAEMSNLCLPLRTPPEFVSTLLTGWEVPHRDFDIYKYPMVQDFAEGRFHVQPELGMIVGPTT